MSSSTHANVYSPALPSSPTLPAAMDPFFGRSSSTSTTIRRAAAIASAALALADSAPSASDVNVMSSSPSAEEDVAIREGAVLDISITVDGRVPVKPDDDIVYWNDVVDDIVDDLVDHYVAVDERSTDEKDHDTMADGDVSANNAPAHAVAINTIAAVNDPLGVSVHAGPPGEIGVAVSCDSAVDVNGNGQVIARADDHVPAGDTSGQASVEGKATPAADQAWAIYKACLEGPCRLSEVLDDDAKMNTAMTLRVPPGNGEPLLNLVVGTPANRFKDRCKLAVFYYLYFLVDEPFARDSHGQTILHTLANRSGQEDRRILRYLLRGAPSRVLDARDKSGDTALMAAVTGGDFQGAEMLLRAGADPNMSGDYQDTPARVAAQQGSLAMVTLMSDYHADIRGCMRLYEQSIRNDSGCDWLQMEDFGEEDK